MTSITPRAAAATSLFVVALTGCGAKFDPTVSVEVAETKLSERDDEKIDVVNVRATPKDYLKTAVRQVIVEGKTDTGLSFGNATIPAEAFPVGKSHHKVTVKGEAKGPFKKWKPVEVAREIDVDRPALPPRARLVSSSGAGCGFTSKRVCVTSPDLSLSDGKATYFLRAPASTKVEILGKTMVGKGSKENVQQAFDLSKEILATQVGGRTTLPVKVTSPDGVSETTSVSIELDTFHVGRAFDAAKKGPMRFGSESAAVGPSKAVALVNGSILSFRGKGTLAELELVAFVESLPARHLGCGTYVGERTGRRITITNSAYDQEVVVYERKTGKVRTRRTFRANMPACESSISSQYTGIKGEVDGKDINAFADTLVGK